MNFTDLPALVVDRIIASHLDTPDKQALACTSRGLNVQVHDALSPAERQLKSAWGATLTENDIFLQQLGDPRAILDPQRGSHEPAARRMAAFGLAPFGEECLSPPPTEEGVRRHRRYLRVQGLLGVAGEMLGGRSALSRPVDGETFNKLFGLFLLGAHHSQPWPMSLLKVLARAPSFFKEEVEPAADTLKFQDGLALALARGIIKPPAPSAEEAPMDPLTMYPVAVHPDFMRGELAWGIDPRKYLFVALSSCAMEPRWRDAWAPETDAVYTYSWTMDRAALPWQRTLSLREGGRVPEEVFYTSGRFVSSSDEIEGVAAYLTRRAAQEGSAARPAEPSA